MTTTTLPLGQVVATPAALKTLERAGVMPLTLLRRHRAGDWGTVCDEDWRANDQAVKNGERILSSYRLDTGEDVWVITEWDRSVTTILLPSDY